MMVPKSERMDSRHPDAYAWVLLIEIFAALGRVEGSRTWGLTKEACLILVQKSAVRRPSLIATKTGSRIPGGTGQLSHCLRSARNAGHH